MTERPKMSYEEQKRRGEAIYESSIRPLIDPSDENKFVLVDVISGDYEMAERSADARVKLRKRRPGAVIHTMRGHRTHVVRFRSPRRITRGTGATP